jgi:hypothetical protein
MMRNFMRFEEDPQSPNYLEPLALFRFEVLPDAITIQRYDRITSDWIDWPQAIGFTGIGGDLYLEIPPAEADQIITKWQAAPDEHPA